ncbi:hypothetical protein GOBAR_AA38466 [Gossypium barbadense]|uniref:Uncharacterized protein n=1 Tax=Gossypium barbadense TaxID=3634 RepID=A0A2P5VTU3_GOSBA|nr:hypothetical protein GOBAR_AA38466 [Gossypium barbadense]
MELRHQVLKSRDYVVEVVTSMAVTITKGSQLFKEPESRHQFYQTNLGGCCWQGPDINVLESQHQGSTG